MASQEGGCQCGAIRYRLVGDAERVNLCHCRMCQRAHGAPVVAWVTIREDQLTMLGEAATFYRSSDKAERGFCGKCGSPMFWKLTQPRAEGPLLDVSAASLDDPTRLQPSEHLWTTSAMPWLRIVDTLRKFPHERHS